MKPTIEVRVSFIKEAPGYDRGGEPRWDLDWKFESPEEEHTDCVDPPWTLPTDLDNELFRIANNRIVELNRRA